MHFLNRNLNFINRAVQTYLLVKRSEATACTLDSCRTIPSCDFYFALKDNSKYYLKLDRANFLCGTQGEKENAETAIISCTSLYLSYEGFVVCVFVHLPTWSFKLVSTKQGIYIQQCDRNKFVE